MKSLLILFTMLTINSSIFAQIMDEYTVIKIGDNVPVFNFEKEKGKKANIQDYKGKLVLINLFATWCPPCRIELPQLQKRIWEKHKNNNQFALFVFGREENWDVLTPFKEKTGFTFPILPDTDRNIFKLFATQAIPRNILIDQMGKVIYQSIGYEKQEFDKLVALIDNQLKQ